ncbi:hypothetical protein [Micromonospora zamorensis]|uniref:hypothetical protein n=1 Tax=Micromonospora zamorensis TaxID=709883 RepID=UPI0033FA156A
MAAKPPDDAGARTADQYEWQAVMAAADGLSLYLTALDAHGNLDDGDDGRLLCEYHEDWVALRNGDAELVSAKHPGLTFGAYSTLNSLAGDGGVAHLFNRWLAMQERPTCRLVTTAGTSGECQQLIKLAEVARDRRVAGETFIASVSEITLLTNFGKSLLKHCDGLATRWKPPDGGEPEVLPEHREQVTRFLSMFTVQDSVTRKYAPHAAPSMYAQPVLDKLGSAAPAGAVWEAVLALFRVRMRAAGPTPTGGLPTVLAFPLGGAASTSGDRETELTSRMVTLADIDLAIRTAIAHPTGFAPLPRLVRTSRLAIKMEVGGCSDNTVERAEQLRSDWTEHWRDSLAFDPEARARQQRLNRALLRINDAAAEQVKRSGTAWGPQLWRELEAALDRQQRTLPDDMDVDLALGGLCELSNRCQVWFSEGFDVASEQARRRPVGGGGS